MALSEHDRRKSELFEQTLAAAGPLPEPAADLREGDLVVLPQTARFYIEWAVLETVGARGAELLVVPADLEPGTGPRDVAVSPGSGSGALVLRCGLATTVTASTLARGERSGRLDPDDLERARRRLRGIRAESLRPTFLEEETEAEAAYHERIEELGLAREALTGTSAAEPPADAAGPGRPRSSATRRSRSAWRAFLGGPLQLAAVILLLLSLGLVARLYSELAEERSQRRQVASELRRERDESAAELRRLSASLERSEDGWSESRRSLEALTEAHRTRVEELEDQLAELSQSGLGVNLPLAYFPPVGTLRGSETPLTLPATARHFILALATREPPYTAYALEVTREGDDEPLWTTSRLRALEGSTELTVLLPAGPFPPGSYAVRLSGVEEGEGTLLSEHLLSIRRPAD